MQTKSDQTPWVPTQGEWGVFWKTGERSYTVSRFACRDNVGPTYGAYITKCGLAFYNIAPIEHLQTLLKD